MADSIMSISRRGFLKVLTVPLAAPILAAAPGKKPVDDMRVRRPLFGDVNVGPDRVSHWDGVEWT